MNDKKFSKVVTLTMIIVITVVGWLFYENFFRSKKEDTNLVINNQPADKKLTMIMAGDALIHSSIYNDAKIDNNHYNFDYLFSYLKPMIKNYDIAFYNQETIIGGKALGLSTYPRFNTPEEFGETMVSLGFNVISLANNHSLDKGERGIINSVTFWHDKNVLTAGTYTSLDDSNKPIIKEKNGIRYTLLSYTTNTNGLKRPTGKEYLLNVYNEEQVRQDVESVRAKVDLLIVSMHWGAEYTNQPTKEQQTIAHYLASLGVDIVIGHHPHVIQPVTYIDGALVFYSLGNLVSAQVGTDRLTGMLCSLDIIKKETNDKITLQMDNIKANFVYTYYKNWRDFKVIPFDKVTDSYLPNHENIYLKYSNIVTSLDDSIEVASINN